MEYQHSCSLLSGKANMLEGISAWELRPSFRGPLLSRLMESGVSSFSEFIHELSVDSDGDSIPGDDENEEYMYALHLHSPKVHGQWRRTNKNYGMVQG
uniref:Uncharacterized protein n=1 Tax=Oryza brachyantha TaxID=4533 RepID=J3M587_ORYBR